MVFYFLGESIGATPTIMILLGFAVFLYVSPVEPTPQF
jgi:hypothetical protein